MEGNKGEDHLGSFIHITQYLLIIYDLISIVLEQKPGKKCGKQVAIYRFFEDKKKNMIRKTYFTQKFTKLVTLVACWLLITQLFL